MKPRSLALLFVTLVAAVACGNEAKPGNFTDTFDGTKYPDKGWLFGGEHPVISTTSGNPAGSLTWTTACTSSSGAVVQVDKFFDSAFSFDMQIDFAIYGAAISSNTGVAFHSYGDYGDDAAAVLYPAPRAEMLFELDGSIVAAAIPADTDWHHLEFAVDQYGEAGWAFDDHVVNLIGPFRSVEYVAEIDCASGAGDTGPVPVLFDNIAVHSRPSP